MRKPRLHLKVIAIAVMLDLGGGLKRGFKR